MRRWPLLLLTGAVAPLFAQPHPDDLTDRDLSREEVGQLKLERDQREWAIEQLQASFIANFPYYVEWPLRVFKEHPDQLLVGFVGSGTIGEAGRQYLQEHPYFNKKFVMENIGEKVDAQTLERYQMLYIGRVSEDEMKHILTLIKKKPILTMSRQRGFLAAGGIIHFVVTQEAVTWDVNMSNGENAELRIDPRLITYGKIMTQPWQQTQPQGYGGATGSGG